MASLFSSLFPLFFLSEKIEGTATTCKCRDGFRLSDLNAQSMLRRRLTFSSFNSNCPHKCGNFSLPFYTRKIEVRREKYGLIKDYVFNVFFFWWVFTVLSGWRRRPYASNSNAATAEAEAEGVAEAPNGNVPKPKVKGKRLPKAERHVMLESFVNQ